MGEYGYGTITIPIKALQIPEVVETLNKEFNNDFKRHTEGRDDTIITFYDSTAYNAQFEELESELSELDVPFDRHSESCCGAYDPETCYFRPAIDGSEKIYQTVTETEEGGSVIPVSDLVAILKAKSNDAIVERLRELLSEVGGYGLPDLRDFIKDWEPQKGD